MNETGKLRTVFLWALLPIVCFALAIPLTNWIAKENDLKTSADYKNIAWGKVIASSPDVVYQDPDSIKYWPWKFRVSAKEGSFEAVEITRLFPEFKAGSITAVNKIGDTNPSFQVYNYNGTLYYGNMVRQDNGDFALAVNDHTKERSKIIPLGEFKGRLNVAIREVPDESPIILVVGILALFFCAVGLGLAFVRVENGSNDSHWTFIAPFITFVASAFILAKGGNTMVWIVGTFCVGEIGLLSGVLFRLYVNKEPMPKDIFSRNAAKMRGFDSPIGEWKEVGGDDKLLINGDGTIYNISQGRTTKLRFKIGDNGSIIASDMNNNVGVVDYVARQSDPRIKTFMEISYNRKTFNRGGIAFESTDDFFYRNEYEVERALGFPEENGRWCEAIGLIVLGAVALLALTQVENIWQAAFPCFFGIAWMLMGIRGLWLICVVRKRKERVRLLCQRGFYSLEQLRRPELDQYVRAALKKRGLTVSEWKSQKESKAQGQMNVNK